MDLYNLVVSAKLTKGGGGGGDIDVDALTVTENGTYTAASGHAYSPVTVNVPSVTPTGNINITSTAQTDVSAYATAQVVDADLVAGNIKKDVNILGVVGTYEGGGGGGSSYTLLHEEDIEVSTTSTSETLIKQINISDLADNCILFAEATDKAGPRADHLYKTITIGVLASGYSYNCFNLIKNSAGQKKVWTTYKRGIYMGAAQTGGSVTISAIYNSSITSAIDGTYHIAIYALALPDGSTKPFPTA